MSTDQTTPETPGAAIPIVPWRTLAALGLVFAMTAAVLLITGNVRERAIEQIDADLSETYGVPIERVDMRLRDGAPSLWSVDGQERECILARDPYTLRCQDGDGAFAEVEQVSK